MKFCPSCIESIASKYNYIRYKDPSYATFDPAYRKWVADAFLEVMRGYLMSEVADAAFSLKKQEDFENELVNNQDKV